MTAGQRNLAVTSDERQVVHNPQALLPLLLKISLTTRRESEPTVKFRCERDVLVEALGAGRPRGHEPRRRPAGAVAACASSSPATTLRLTGSDLDLTITSTTTVAGERDGVGRAAGQARHRHRPRARAAARSRSRSTATRPASAAGRSQFSVRLLPADEFPRLPVPAERGRRRSTPTAFAEALRQVVPAASADDARPILTGVLMAAEGDGLRLVATDSYRLAVRDLPGTSVLREGQSVLVPSRALQRARRGCSATPSEVTLRLGERDASLRGRRRPAHHPADRGRVPELPRADPAEPPQPAHRRPRGAARRGAARAAAGPRGHAGAPGHERRRPRAGRHHPGRRPGPRAARRQVRGPELTVAFNPEYLLDGIEVTPGDEVTSRRSTR